MFSNRIQTEIRSGQIWLQQVYANIQLNIIIRYLNYFQRSQKCKTCDQIYGAIKACASQGLRSTDTKAKRTISDTEQHQLKLQEIPPPNNILSFKYSETADKTVQSYFILIVTSVICIVCVCSCVCISRTAKQMSHSREIPITLGSSAKTGH